MTIINATDATFAEEIKSGLVLVDFWATWCGPCKMIAPVLEEMDAEFSEQLKIVKVDVDANSTTAANLGVLSIPTMLLYKDGEVVDKVVGFRPKQAMVEFVSKHF